MSGNSIGTANFGFGTSDNYQQQVDLPFFKQFFKNVASADLPEALTFETGANR